LGNNGAPIFEYVCASVVKLSLSLSLSLSPSLSQLFPSPNFLALKSICITPLCSHSRPYTICTISTIQIHLSGAVSAGAERCDLETKIKTCSWKSKLKHVVVYVFYWDVSPMVSICVIHELIVACMLVRSFWDCLLVQTFKYCVRWVGSRWCIVVYYWYIYIYIYIYFFAFLFVLEGGCTPNPPSKSAWRPPRFTDIFHQVQLNTYLNTSSYTTNIVYAYLLNHPIRYSMYILVVCHGAFQTCTSYMHKLYLLYLIEGFKYA